MSNPRSITLLVAALFVAGCSISDLPSDPAIEGKSISPSTPPTVTKSGTPDAKTREKEKIEALIAHVGQMKEALFIRNGAEYDAATAAASMRQKWAMFSWQIATAGDFITHVASTSTTTGKPYLIKLKKGAEPIPFGEYLRGELKKLEAADHFREVSRR